MITKNLRIDNLLTYYYISTIVKNFCTKKCIYLKFYQSLNFNPTDIVINKTFIELKKKRG